MHRRHPVRSALASFRSRNLVRSTSRPLKLTEKQAVNSIEYLEERVLFALARAAGGSGFSGTLSTNPQIRQQQLICDPVEPSQGSDSVKYDPTQVSLAGLAAGPGYANKDFGGVVEVKPFYCPTTKVLQSISSFLSCPIGTETGYAQVYFKLSGTAGQIQVPAGYTVLDDIASPGADTHAFQFKLCPGVPTTAQISYQIFAAKANQFSGNKEDFLLTNDPQPVRIGPANLSPATLTSAPAPVVSSAGGPYRINEGSGLTLIGAASVTGGGTLSYAWDLNGDGQTDATGPTPTLTPAALATLGLADGPKTANVRLTVTAGTKTAVAVTTLTVDNVAPTATTGYTEAFLGTPMTLRVSAADPSAVDQAAGFTYLINWGDSTPVQTVTATAGNGAGLLVQHNYNAVGVRDVSVKAVDKDGGTSAPCMVQATVSGAQIRPDPSDASLRALNVVGTSGNDTIRFTPVSGGLQVTINGVNRGTFSGFGRVLAYGLAGNDDIRLYDAPGVLYGNTGDDTLITGNFSSVLVGGDGKDVLTVGNCKNVLIGGAAADTLNGGGDEDILLAGKSAFDGGTDADVFGVTAILKEWTSTNTYESRVAHLTGSGVGYNGPNTFITGVNALDDGVADTLNGGGGRDFFLLKKAGAGVLDISDAASNETAIGL